MHPMTSEIGQGHIDHLLEDQNKLLDKYSLSILSIHMTIANIDIHPDAT